MPSLRLFNAGCHRHREPRFRHASGAHEASRVSHLRDLFLQVEADYVVPLLGPTSQGEAGIRIRAELFAERGRGGGLQGRHEESLCADARPETSEEISKT